MCIRHDLSNCRKECLHCFFVIGLQSRLDRFLRFMVLFKDISFIFADPLCTGQKVLSVDEKGIVIQSTKDCTESRIDADNVIVALGVKSQNALLKPLKEIGVQVLAAGDANAPGRIMEATLDAVNLAYGFME